MRTHDFRRSQFNLSAYGSDFALVWSSVLIFDGAIFVMTFIRGLLTRRSYGRMWGRGLFFVMSRDGERLEVLSH